MDKMQQSSLQRLKQPIEFAGYAQLQASLIKTLNDLGVDSGVMTVINNDDNPREAGKARASFAFRRRGRGVEVEAFGIKGALWPEEDFKAWWKNALAGEKTQFNLNYGFFAFRLSDVGPKLSVTKRAEAAQESAVPVAEPRDSAGQDVVPEADRGVGTHEGQTPLETQPLMRDEPTGPPVPESAIVAEFTGFGDFRREILQLFSEQVPPSRENAMNPASLFLYVQQEGEIVGDGYELVRPRAGARIVKAKIGEISTSIYAHGFEDDLMNDIHRQGITGDVSFVVTRDKLPE